MLQELHDWQMWVPIGIALMICVPSLILISTACSKKNPESENSPQKPEREDSPLSSGFGCLACFVLLFVSVAAGVWVVNQMDPSYFAEEKPCVSCGAMNLETDEYCAECGIKQVPTCAACGEEIRDNSKFCPSCGTQVETQTETQPTIPTCLTCKEPCDTPYCPSCGTKIPRE